MRSVFALAAVVAGLAAGFGSGGHYNLKATLGCLNSDSNGALSAAGVQKVAIDRTPPVSAAGGVIVMVIKLGKPNNPGHLSIAFGKDAGEAQRVAQRLYQFGLMFGEDMRAHREIRGNVVFWGYGKNLDLRNAVKACLH